MVMLHGGYALPRFVIIRGVVEKSLLAGCHSHMTFVYPIILGGLLAAGIPVLLHFLVRDKPKSLLFPAFRFLLQQCRTNTRKLRLRHLLLMLLRAVLLALLCFASGAATLLARRARPEPGTAGDAPAGV